MVEALEKRLHSHCSGLLRQSSFESVELYLGAGLEIANSSVVALGGCMLTIELSLDTELFRSADLYPGDGLKM